MDYALCSGKEYFPSIMDDERKILDLSVSLDFSKGVFGPKTWIYPTLGLFLYRAALEVGDFLNIVEPVELFLNGELTPDQLKRFYMVGRYLALIISLLLIITVALVTSRMLGDAEGLIAATLVAVLPSMVIIGRVAKFHSLAILFMVLALYFAWMASMTDRKIHYVFTGILVGLTVSSMYIVSIFIVIYAAKVVYLWSIQPRTLVKASLDKKVWIGYGISLAVLSVISVFMILNTFENGLGWLQDIGRARKDKFFIDPYGEGVLYYFQWYLFYSFGPFFLILLGFGAYYINKLSTKALALITIVGLFNALAQVILTIQRFLVYHSSWYAPFFAMIVAFATVTGCKQKPFRQKVLFICIAALAILWNVFFSIQIISWQSKTFPQVQASRWLAEKVDPAEPLATIDNFKELYPYILNPQNHMEDYHREVDVIEVRNNIEKLISSGAKYFVVPEWELYGLRDKYLRYHSKYPKQYKFAANLDSGEEFKRVQIFANEPPWPKVLFGARLMPRDMMMFGQKVLIYERQ